MPDSVPKIVRLSWARRIKQRVTNFDDQNFDGHVTTELGVVRLVDDAHTAFAYLCDDFVATKFCARGNRHEAPINLGVAKVYSLQAVLRNKRWLNKSVRSAFAASQMGTRTS